MGMWQRHRQRQAGKYAKRSHRLEVQRLANTPEARAARAGHDAHRAAIRAARQRHRREVSLDNRVRALLAPKAPRRPDLPGSS